MKQDNEKNHIAQALQWVFLPWSKYSMETLELCPSCFKRDSYYQPIRRVIGESEMYGTLYWGIDYPYLDAVLHASTPAVNAFFEKGEKP